MRIMFQTQELFQVSEEMLKDLVQWNQDEMENFFICRGWSPPVDPVSGYRDYYFEVDWREVQKVADDPDPCMADEIEEIVKALLKHKEEILAGNNWLVWEGTL